MEPESSLLHSQGPANCPFPQPVPSSPYPPYPTSWTPILILSSHLRLGLPSGLFPSGLPTKTMYTPLNSSNWFIFVFCDVLSEVLMLCAWMCLMLSLDCTAVGVAVTKAGYLNYVCSDNYLVRETGKIWSPDTQHEDYCIKSGMYEFEHLSFP